MTGSSPCTPPSALLDSLSSMCSALAASGRAWSPSLVGGWAAVPWSWFPASGLLAGSLLTSYCLRPASAGPTLPTCLWANLAALHPGLGTTLILVPSVLGAPRSMPFLGECQPLPGTPLVSSPAKYR